MNLSNSELKVIQLLEKKLVAKRNFLQEKLKVSRITVLRALKKHGYHSSYNFNSSYFVLKGFPEFNKEGIWSYNKINFSCHGTLKQTVRTLIELSPEGLTVVELENKLLTRVHNPLSLLLQNKEIDKFYVGRNTVYVAVNSSRKASQEEQRKFDISKEQNILLLNKIQGKQVPEGLDPLNVISLLVQKIKTPNASVASLSKTLHAQGISINSEQIRDLIEFYSLKKKRKIEYGSINE